MLDVKKIREDFPMFKNYPTMQKHRFCYLDNAATTFKPVSVIKGEEEYYEKLCGNSHRGDYDLAHDVDVMYASCRKTVADFINAQDIEISFTSGASMSLNTIAYGLSKFLEPGDEILLSEAEHASNVLPWFAIAHQKGCHVTYVPLENGRVTIDNFKKALTKKTKIVSLAQVTNVLGYIVDVKSLAKTAHEHGAYFVVDAAQSAPHMKIDVKDLDCDFMAFSAHKMCGPTGIGVMYGKYDLLKQMDPLLTGGGMNTRFDTCGDVLYQLPPLKFEAGTQNLAGALGFKKAVEYLNEIGLDNIQEHEAKMRKRIIDGLKDIDDVIIYNPDAESGIITFNFKGVFAQDGASLLNSKGVCCRSGNHCAKVLLNYLGTDATIRCSLYFYNDEEDCDQFVEACHHGKEFLDAYFN